MPYHDADVIYFNSIKILCAGVSLPVYMYMGFNPNFVFHRWTDAMLV